MPSTLRALVRWSAIGGLWLLIAFLIIPTFLLRLVSGGGLSVVEWAKGRIDALLGWGK